MITGENVKDLVCLTVDTDGPQGTATADITATDHHPFWEQSTGQWVRIDALTSADVLSGADGEQIPVENTHEWAQFQRVHNLTVTNLHTYYVLAGATPVLVHNSNGLCGPDAEALQYWDQATFKNLEETAKYHLDKHGKGRTFAEYTQEARDLWRKTDPKNRIPWQLGNGDTGWKIRGGLLGGEGIYTKEGKIVTWHD